MTTVVDYYSPKGRSFMDCLVANDVSGIARYLTNSPTDPRQATDSEILDAHSAGLSVHFFYEMDPTRPEYFTFAQGAEDCRQAVERLRELGAPTASVVYFAIDAPPSRIPPELLDKYFNGVESMQTPQITPGIYGFEAHVEYARASFKNVGKHLAQTYGTPRGPLDLYQHEQLAMCGVAVDLNECSVAGWRPKERHSMTPQRTGQSADLTLKPGEVGLLQAFFQYDSGARDIQRKVVASAPGRRIVTIYPPADPDADPTEILDAEPAIFVVDVVPAA